jgi:hypothetical protein
MLGRTIWRMEGLIFLAALALIYYLCEVFAWGNCHKTIVRKSGREPSSHYYASASASGLAGPVSHNAPAREETSHDLAGQACDRAAERERTWSQGRHT